MDAVPERMGTVLQSTDRVVFSRFFYATGISSRKRGVPNYAPHRCGLQVGGEWGFRGLAEDATIPAAPPTRPIAQLRKHRTWGTHQIHECTRKFVRRFSCTQLLLSL